LSVREGLLKSRIDLLVVERGIAGSRQKARALILAGKILVEGVPALKAGEQVPESSRIELKQSPEDLYAGRGALKIKAAAEHFGIDFNRKTVMDIGASTGGFTDYMLQQGALRAYCVDVGYGQLHERLRADRRVILFEKTNVRHLQKSSLPEEMDFISVDVSFISLKLVIPKIMEFLKPGGRTLMLVKPQFETGRADVGKGGVVKDEAKRFESVESVSRRAAGAGLEVLGVFESPVRGQKKGNIEYFIYAEKKA
jgi:23S rRNA (cytidine1920-2'-O)/16S rRNA (cytidine1409-2'-O)-methyltransferase